LGKSYTKSTTFVITNYRVSNITLQISTNLLIFYFLGPYLYWCILCIYFY